VVKVDTVASTKWLALQEITYNDEEGKERKWNRATRTTKKESSKADAVVIVPILKHYNRQDVVDTLLVEQFRPPVGRKTIEFPAGLIDDSESPEDAALRELREETGYVGEKCKTIPRVSEAVCMSPGAIDESVIVVVVMVDLDNPYNKNPKPQPDEGEYLQVKRVSLKEGLQKVLEDADSMPIQGLYLFALGLEMGKSIEANTDQLI